MTDAPEKIWAYAGSFNIWRDRKTDMGQRQTEYTRTDVADARITQLEEALRVTEKALRVFGAKTDFYRVAARVARTALKGEDK
jgi:hypothetical protein